MIAALLFACCFVAPADVTIDSETITLGALIPFPPPDPRVSIHLGYAPNPGVARRIAKYEIEGKVKAAGLAVDDLRLPDSILVHRRSAALDRGQVTRAVLDAFIKEFPNANIEITSIEIPAMQVGTGAVEIAASLPARFDLVNSVFVRLDVRGVAFSRNAFVRTKVKVVDEQGAAVSKVAPAPQVFIRKGDSVTVKSSLGAVTIAATMRAMTSGRVGETIPVAHLSGEGTTSARIVGPRTLEVHLENK